MTCSGPRPWPGCWVTNPRASTDGCAAAPQRPWRASPVVLRPPRYGGGLAYAGLTQHLGPDQPLYAIQARALSELGHSPESVEEMVEDYLPLIREVQPHGPYRFLGWSFGGTVAHTRSPCGWRSWANAPTCWP
ncbi:thioesterase domain-containing protein [Streptomyces cirratus]